MSSFYAGRFRDVLHKGAPEKVFQQCTSYYKQGSVIPLGAKDWEMFSDAVSAMSSKGLRGMFQWLSVGMGITPGIYVA